MGPSVVGAGTYTGLYAQDLSHEGLAQIFLRRALSHNLAGIKNQEPVAENGRVVDVMQSNHRSQREL